MRTAMLATGAFALLATVTSTANANVILDLTTSGASQTSTAALGGAFQVQQISNPSGVQNPFLRIQETGNELGYNHDAATEQLDETLGFWTHALLLSDIPVVTIGGTEYRQFLLDINQSDSAESPTDQFLSLDQIQIFQTNSPTLVHTALSAASSGSAALIGFATASEIFRMNNAGNANALEIQLNYALNKLPGQAPGDMFLYVRSSLFDPALSNVILFSQFGVPNGAYPSNDGFEEWQVVSGGTVIVVPEPSTLALLAAVALLLVPRASLASRSFRPARRA